MFMTVDSLLAIRPVLYLVVGMVFLWLLGLMSFYCFRRNLPLHGMHLALVALGFFGIGILEDFVKLPTSEENPYFNSFVIPHVLMIWGFWGVYVGYAALHRRGVGDKSEKHTAAAGHRVGA